jgi:prefoldin subunit 5
MVEDKINEVKIDLAVSTEKINRLQEDMEQLTKSMTELSKAIAEINLTLSSSKGSIRMLMIVGSACAALGSAVAELLHVWR